MLDRASLVSKVAFALKKFVWREAGDRKFGQHTLWGRYRYLLFLYGIIFHHCQNTDRFKKMLFYEYFVKCVVSGISGNNVTFCVRKHRLMFLKDFFQLYISINLHWICIKRQQPKSRRLKKIPLLLFPKICFKTVFEEKWLLFIGGFTKPLKQLAVHSCLWMMTIVPLEVKVEMNFCIF